MKISFIGDICLNSEYIKLFNKGIDPFSEVSAKLKDSDLVVANLECLCKGETGTNPLRSVKLHTEKPVLNYLNNIRVNLVTLAHNHIYDNLEDGFSKTLDFLEKNDIAYIGAGSKATEDKHIFTFKKNGIKVYLLNYVHPDTKPNLPADIPLSVSLYNKNKIIEDIQKLQNQSGFIILLFHWGGNVEGGLYPDRYQFKDTKKYITAGADLIIGHHSHTFQPFEIIKGKHVFYSLGDFCADNIYKGGRRFQVRSESAVLQIEFQKDEYEISLLPVKNANLNIQLNPFFIKKMKKRNRILKVLKFYPFWFLYFLHLKILEPFLYYFFGYKRSFWSKLKDVNFYKIRTYFQRIVS